MITPCRCTKRCTEDLATCARLTDQSGETAKWHLRELG
jgi:hypothetical protein